MKNERLKQFITPVIIVAAVGILFAVANIMGVKTEVTNDYIKVTAFMFSETVQLSYIEDVQIMEDVNYGKRTFGVGIPGIQTGTFENMTFGNYNCAIMTSNPKCIAVKKQDGVYLVFNSKDKAETEAIFAELERITKPQ